MPGVKRPRAHTLRTCMRSHMNDQLTRLDECLIAHRATMRSFTRMDSHVPMQFTAMLERPAAHFTFVRTFLGMDAPMHL